jgi:hypothetical protein
MKNLFSKIMFIYKLSSYCHDVVSYESMVLFSILCILASFCCLSRKCTFLEGDSVCFHRHGALEGREKASEVRAVCTAYQLMSAGNKSLFCEAATCVPLSDKLY